MTLDEFVGRLDGARRSGKGYIACCPAHDDSTASLKIDAGNDGRILLKCHAGCEVDSILQVLGVGKPSLFPEGTSPGRRDPVARYAYQDEHGELVFEVCRFWPKDFRQRKPDPTAVDGWSWKLNGVRRVLYHLPELVAADPEDRVFVVEGEKDADRLRALGLVATCNAGGAGKWRDEYSEHLRGRDVVILPDNDDAGRSHAAKVAASLSELAARLRIVPLPGLKDKGDVSDWLEGGGDRAQLEQLVARAPEWSPEIDVTAWMPPTAHELLWIDRPPVVRYATGFADLDDLVGGGLPGRALTVVVGPTGVGKTGAVLTMTWQVASALATPTLYVSTELDDEECAARVAAATTGRPIDAYLSGAIPRSVARSDVAGVPIHIVAADRVTRGPAALEQISRWARTVEAQHKKPPIVIVDFLQLLANVDSRESRLSVSEVAGGLRALAQSLNTAVVAVSSCSRAFYRGARNDDDRDDPLFYLASAKESGDIEYAAAVVLYLDVGGEATDGVYPARIVVAKARRGRRGFAGARFHGPSGKWSPDATATALMNKAPKDTSEQDRADEAALIEVLREHADRLAWRDIRTLSPGRPERFDRARVRLIASNRIRVQYGARGRQTIKLVAGSESANERAS